MGIRLSTAAPLRGRKRWNFLERCETIRVATQCGDEAIYLSALWYVIHEERIFIPLDQASKHKTNMERGGRLSAVVDEGHAIADVRGVHIEGSAVLVEDRQFHEELEELVLNKYFYEGDPFLEEYVNFGEYNDRQFYEIVPERMYGFDLREATLFAGPEKRVFPDFMIEGNGKS
jgi:hypothetical protein